MMLKTSSWIGRRWLITGQATRCTEHARHGANLASVIVWLRRCAVPCGPAHLPLDSVMPTAPIIVARAKQAEHASVSKAAHGFWPAGTVPRQNHFHFPLV
jgi:hypothetical protein